MNQENFKITEVGWIPKDWEVKTLEELFSPHSTASFSRDQMNADDEIYCVHYGDIHTKYGHVVELGKDVTPMISSQQAGRFMRLIDGDVILADASEDYEGVGKAIVVLTNDKPAISGLHTILLRKKNDNAFSTTFPAYMFAGRTVKQQIEQLSEGTKINSISFRKIKDVLAIYPKETSEQCRISEVLSDTDSLIASLSRTIEKKRLVKQGAMQQLLTGKTRLKGFSGEWVEKELGELLKYEQPQEYIVHDTEYIETGIPVLTAGKTFILGYTHEQDGIYDKLPCILFDDFTTASRFVNFKFKVKSSAAKILTLRDKINDLRLIYELMQLIDFPLQDHQRYWISEFSHVTIKLPEDPNEQFAISERLRTMDNEIASLEAELRKYKALKQGMMQKLLTGEIRLPICQTTE